jgi:signal transduction histidine kinase
VEAEYLATNSIAENFAMVADGRADAVVELRIPGRAHAKQFGLVASPVIFSPITFGFATQKGRNGDLIKELDAFVSEGKDVAGSPYDQIMEKWLGTQSSVEWRVPRYVFAIILAVATVALLSVGVSLLLRHQVNRRTSALRTERDLVTRLMETSPVGIVLVGVDGRVSLANARADELFGVVQDDAAKSTNGREAPGAAAGGGADHSPPADSPLTVEELAFAPLTASATDVIESREPVYGVAITTGAADRRLQLEVNGTPVFSESGELTGALLAIMDVSDRERAREELESYRAHLEDLVGQRTAALETANEQLESFSYSVSHDLRAPLRALDGFSYALLEDVGDRLDDASRGHLLRIRSASQHMAELIDALLKLSRAGRAELELSDVSITGMAERVAAELSAGEPERAVDWDIQSGLSARADAALADVVIENLLSNAWKFSAGRDPAHITVGEAEMEDGPVFFVRDDGVGFDPAHADKLFHPFERLHAREEFPGTGIGLATVRRVLARHGGRCWANGSKDEGAVVYFTFGQVVRAGESDRVSGH